MPTKQRKWQLKKQELGLCTIYGKAAATHKCHCGIHYAASLESTRKWYREHGGRERKQQYKLAKKPSSVPGPRSPVSLPRKLFPPKAKESSWLTLDIIPEGDLIGVLSLGANQGSVIGIAAEGVDAETALDALQSLVENNFSLQGKQPDNSSQTNEIRQVPIISCL